MVAVDIIKTYSITNMTEEDFLLVIRALKQLADEPKFLSENNIKRVNRMISETNGYVEG